MRKPTFYKFRLYVAGDTENSSQALNNLKAICADHLPHRHAIEVVDVVREPKRGLADGIFMTPTLVKMEPDPCRKIIGNLSQKQSVIESLGLNELAR